MQFLIFLPSLLKLLSLHLEGGVAHYAKKRGRDDVLIHPFILHPLESQNKCF